VHLILIRFYLLFLIYVASGVAMKLMQPVRTLRGSVRMMKASERLLLMTSAGSRMMHSNTFHHCSSLNHRSA
jgi:hypothetical protein